MTLSIPHLKDMLSDVQQGRRLRSAEIVQLLSLARENALEMLFETARNIRKENFGSRVFTYGFAYTSTFCRNNCTFCYFRRSNKQPQRYRKKTQDVLEVAKYLSKKGVNLMDLTMGEDPQFHGTQNGVLDDLIQLVKDIKAVTDLPVMISPGVVPDETLARLAAAGVTWYACYQETHNPALFETLRIGQRFEERLEKKRVARKLGLLIEEGLLCGIGESSSDIAHSIQVMHALNVDQVRVMKFVPQPGTPMAAHKEEASLRECHIMAVLRLSFPDRLIPASLDVDGLAGLKMRLDAGANVITSLVPPDYGLSGVAHHELDIENANRTMAGIKPILEMAGLSVADPIEYRQWVKRRQQASSR
jgi:methylornithine synthase